MNFRDARDLAIEFGAALPVFAATSPLAQPWIDRIAALIPAADRGEKALTAAVKEANRYSGRSGR
jgi:hypothetical protein